MGLIGIGFIYNVMVQFIYLDRLLYLYGRFIYKISDGKERHKIIVLK
jgi:hypothetical protein